MLKPVVIHILLFFLITSCIRINIKSEEKNILLTELDFEQYGFEFQSSVAGKYKKYKYLDGSYEIEYEFDGYDKNSAYLFISNTLITDLTEEEAEITYQAEGVVTKLSHLIKSEFLPVEGFLYGNRSELFIWYVEGVPTGNMCRFQISNRTYYLIIGGIYFNNLTEWMLFFNDKIANKNY